MHLQGFIQDFLSERGKARVRSTPKLGGLGDMLGGPPPPPPKENFEIYYL